MLYKRMPIEIESPEETGYEKIDYNLSESSMPDLKMSDLGFSIADLELSYIAHRGKALFRSSIAEGYGLSNPDQVLITSGAAAALFIINTALLSHSDHLIVVRPNYATNIEVPRAIGCSISFIDLVYEQGWRIDPQQIAAAIQPHTKLISITTPHNPTGMVMHHSEIKQLIRIAENSNIMLLADETYRDTCFTTPYPLLASLSKQVISVSSLSKVLGLPGLRIGWIVTQNEALMEQFLAAKEMMYINNSVLDEEVAYQFYRQKDTLLPAINSRAQQNFELLKTWLAAETRLEAVLPQGGVVCFVRLRKGVQTDTQKLYHTLMHGLKTMVGAGHWFEMPDTYMRIGFGFVTAETLREGLQRISRAIDASLIG
jgi:aspartate/methionine/tyrosine aminotransferase